MTRNRYPKEFKEQALSKARQRGERTLDDVAQDLNMSVGTLKGWLQVANHRGTLTPAGLPLDLSAQHWSPAQRLLALQESHALSGPELHAWCREKGLFEHQLRQWRDAFCSPAETTSSTDRAALRSLQSKHDKLASELRRKEKALAEAAALLVLQKKFQALFDAEG